MTQREKEIKVLLRVLSENPNFLFSEMPHTFDLCQYGTEDSNGSGCQSCVFYGGDYPDIKCRLDVDSYANGLVSDLEKIIPEKFL